MHHLEEFRCGPVRIGRVGQSTWKIAGFERAERIVEEPCDPIGPQQVTLPREPDRAGADDGHRYLTLSRIDERQQVAGPQQPGVFGAQIKSEEEFGQFESEPLQLLRRSGIGDHVLQPTQGGHHAATRLQKLSQTRPGRQGGVVECRDVRGKP